MNRLGKVLGTIGHLMAAIVLGALDFGDTPWLHKKVDEESDQVGRLI